jgi:nucleoside-diphosphate-sugar epimerase
MTVLIIGCGFIGLPLATKLQILGYEITVTTSQKSKQKILENKGLFSLKFNSNLQEDYIQFKNYSFDYIIYTLPPNVCKSISYDHVLFKLIPSLSQKGIVVFTSSISVYQNNRALHTEESLSLNDSSIIFKAENVLIQNRYPHYIFRLAGLIGENRHPKNFIKSGVIKNSNQYVNLLRGEDAVEAIVLSITNKIPFGIYNICSPEHPTRETYYHNYTASPLFIEGKEGKLIDTSKITNVLNYKYKSIYL